MTQGRQHGAAILSAMLTVAMVAVLASAMMWQVWRSYEVEAAQRTRIQSAWILSGALDWARLILREDAREGGADALSEPWAVPLAPARLSDFLAAERGQTLVGDDNDPSQEAFLAGAIEDQQARLNVRNLIEGDQISEVALQAWGRLFVQLNLPQSELTRLSRALLAASATTPVRPGERRPLWPHTPNDLLWLGLSPASLVSLKPWITVLPERTPVNLNTASALVLVAAVQGLDMAQAEDLVRTRSKKRFNVLSDVAQQLGDADIALDAKWHGVSSRFFEVVGQLKVGQTLVQERSLIQRDGLQVRALHRHRESLTLLPQPEGETALSVPADLQ